MSITDHNKVIFNHEWEFIHASGDPVEVTNKLNQWKKTFDLVFISVRFEGGNLDYLIARKKERL